MENKIFKCERPFLPDKQREQMSWKLYHRELLIDEDGISIPLKPWDHLGDNPDIKLETMHYDFYAVLLKMIRSQLKSKFLVDDAKPYLLELEKTLNKMFIDVAPGTQYDPIRVVD